MRASADTRFCLPHMSHGHLTAGSGTASRMSTTTQRCWATQGLDIETDCRGWVMHVDWSQNIYGAHPRSYTLREISAARLRLLRMPTDNCGYPAAIKYAPFERATPTLTMRSAGHLLP